MRTRFSGTLEIRQCELLRHNNVKRLLQKQQPGNASAPQNQLQRYSWGFRPWSETGDYTRQAIPMSSGDATPLT